MEKFEFSPCTSACCMRRMRTQVEWNVATHIRCATGPTSPATRSRISAAALLVKVMARIWPGCTPRSAMRCAMRRVSTAVLPEPAPATISSGDPACSTAARCCGLSPSSRSARLPKESGPAGPVLTDVLTDVLSDVLADAVKPSSAGPVGVKPCAFTMMGSA